MGGLSATTRSVHSPPRPLAAVTAARLITPAGLIGPAFLHSPGQPFPWRPARCQGDDRSCGRGSAGSLPFCEVTAAPPEAPASSPLSAWSSRPGKGRQAGQASLSRRAGRFFQPEPRRGHGRWDPRQGCSGHRDSQERSTACGPPEPGVSIAVGSGVRRRGRSDPHTGPGQTAPDHGSGPQQPINSGSSSPCLAASLRKPPMREERSRPDRQGASRRGRNIGCR
jgi:hypothetical protein